MPSDQLARFLGSAIAPFLQSRGYRKNRRTFRQQLVGGDYAVIDFYGWHGHPRWPCLLAEFGYVVHKPRPYLPPDVQAEVAKDPPAYKGHLRLRIKPPSQFRFDVGIPEYDSVWALPEPENAGPVEQAVIAVLGEQLFPLIDRIVGGERNAYELTAANLTTMVAVAPFERVGSHLHTPIYGDDDWFGGRGEP